jgi:hypothetical protein
MVLEQLEDGRVGLAGALACGLQAVADAVVAHVVDQRGHQPGAAAAQRMAERDRAAVDVQRLGVRPELGRLLAGGHQQRGRAAAADALVGHDDGAVITASTITASRMRRPP